MNNRCDIIKKKQRCKNRAKMYGLVMGERVLHSNEVAADVWKLTSSNCTVLRHFNELVSLSLSFSLSFYLFLSLSLSLVYFVFHFECVFQLDTRFIGSSSTRAINADKIDENQTEMMHQIQAKPSQAKPSLSIGYYFESSQAKSVCQTWTFRLISF